MDSREQKPIALTASLLTERGASFMITPLLSRTSENLAMNRQFRLAHILIASMLLFTIAPARAQNLTKAEIGKLGKAGTVYVEAPGRGSGSGFCVHSSGFFITNAHVITGSEKANVTLVVNSSLTTQRVLNAKV